MKVLSEITAIYSQIEREIKQRLQELKAVGQCGDCHKLFEELCFCLLTPQSRARSADAAMKRLLDTQVLYTGDAFQIAEYLNVVRFKNNKARYIVEAREKIFQQKELDLSELGECEDPVWMRESLVRNVKGYGYKEASHFLRNIGYGKDIAILDRHILKNMVYAGVIAEIPVLTKRNYLRLEKEFLLFANKLKIPSEELDFVLWYKETGEIFK